MKDLLKEERFLPVPEHPTYYVSNYGRVWSERSHKYLGCKVKDWYVQVSFAPLHKPAFVHRLVAKLFLGEPPDPKMQVNHKDGNKHNCHASNLEWVTQQENVVHAFATGLMRPHSLKGEKSRFAKLDWPKVREIRRAYVAGEMNQSQLARLYDVDHKAIWFILHNRTWRE